MPRGEMVRRTRERRPPLDDVAVAIAWWDRRSLDADDEDALLGDEIDDWNGRAGGYAGVTEPYRAPPKVGCNEPCVCGNGTKYKKCYGRTA